MDRQTCGVAFACSTISATQCGLAHSLGILSVMIDAMPLCPSWLTTDLDAAAKLLPITASFHDGQWQLGGMSVTQIIAEFGSPVYVMDEQDFKARATAFRDAFAPWHVYYASKAFLSRTVARWARECGLGVDVCSAGELATALSAGVAAQSIGVHGNNKSQSELATAIATGVGHIVVDTDDEIDRLAAIAGASPIPVPVLVRVTPNVEAHTHAHVQTAIADQKFGFALDGGVALGALLRLREVPGIKLVGVHCHIGSQILDTSGFEQAIDRLIGLLASYRDSTGEQLTDCGIGGGFGIAYTQADAVSPPSQIASVLHDALERARHQAGLGPLNVFIEPGRAIVGPACVALYTVGTVKPVHLSGGIRTYVAVDGGLADNPRPALYQAEYSALLANRDSSAPPMLCRVVGKYCETGDILVLHTYLPSDIRPGDIVAVPSSGAYQRAMASNYNGSLRPPVVAVRDGRGTTMLRRETIDDLLALDVGR